MCEVSDSGLCYMPPNHGRLGAAANAKETLTPAAVFSKVDVDYAGPLL